MKLFSIRILMLFSITIFLLPSFAIAQSKYEFKGATLISGTALSIGAVYKFSSVKAGADATVTIADITGGISITNIDGGGGFDKALQPVISVPANRNGYIEFKIDFFEAGTNNPLIQPEVPVTPIDVDGQMYSGLPLYEFDEVDMPNGYTYFQWAGSELNMSRNGTWARGKNKAAVDYPGIDTAQKTVMFTTINANISSISIRVGADNQSNTGASRLRSLYFQRFSYPFEIVLPNRTLISFNGVFKSNQVELKGVLSASHTYDKIIIEKSSNGSFFEEAGNLAITNSGSGEFPFTFLDSHPYEGVNYYRIKLVNTIQKIYEISNTIMIKVGNEKKMFTFYNTILRQADPAVTIQCNDQKEVQLEVADMAGRMVYSKKTKLMKGVNVVDLPYFKAGRGYFVLVVRTAQEFNSQKIIVQ